MTRNNLIFPEGRIAKSILCFGALVALLLVVAGE
jgi:hypothetical protein